MFFKKKLIFLFIFLFLFFSYFSNCYALTFSDSNQIEHEVTDYETLRDYCYFTYKISSNDESLSFLYLSNRTCYYSYNNGLVRVAPNSASYCLYSNNNCVSIHKVVFDSSFNITSTTNTTYFTYNSSNFKFSNLNFYDSDSSTVVRELNYTFNDIEQKYSNNNSSSTEQENQNNNSIITKNEFYVLLVLVGTLIIMLFLKWCFPFKGGTDL